MEGDFEASFTFDSFSSGGEGGFFQVAISHVDSGDRAIGGMGTVTPIAAGLQIGGGFDLTDHEGAQNWIPSGATSGIASIVRIGNELTISVDTDENDVSISDTLAGDGLTIGVQIGNNHPDTALTGTTSVQVTGFVIAGGGGSVTSDTFDCDSVLP